MEGTLRASDRWFGSESAASYPSAYYGESSKKRGHGWRRHQTFICDRSVFGLGEKYFGSLFCLYHWDYSRFHTAEKDDNRRGRCGRNVLFSFRSIDCRKGGVGVFYRGTNPKLVPVFDVEY